MQLAWNLSQLLSQNRGSRSGRPPALKQQLEIHRRPAFLPMQWARLLQTSWRLDRLPDHKAVSCFEYRCILISAVGHVPHQLWQRQFLLLLLRSAQIMARVRNTGIQRRQRVIRRRVNDRVWRLRLRNSCRFSLSVYTALPHS